MSALASEHQAINLSQGFPDFDPDPLLSECINEALLTKQVQYAPMPGRLDLRESIAAQLDRDRGVEINPTTEITITAGATQALFTAMAAIINPGDEVIVFDPAYDCYDPTIRLFGGIPIHLELIYPDYTLDWDKLKTSLSSKTRLVIINNPHNPTGTVWDRSDIERFATLLEDYPNALVISDEVYEYIRFKDSHCSVLQNELLRKRSFAVFSFGKTLHVTGWKLGYIVAPPELTDEFRKVHQFNVFCVNNTVQYAVNQYLKKGQDLTSIAPFYEAKRDLFLESIGHSRFRALSCKGTYFCLLNYSTITDEKDTDFARRLTIEHQIASIPVSAFYLSETDHKVLRFCFAKKNETLLRAAEKLCKI